MAYRNGTYIAFHANNTTDPTESDIKYYNLLKAWKVRDENDFYFVDSHEKNASVRDSSKRATLEQRLKERLNSSKNLILIVGKTTKEDTDWVPFEIRYAVDQCGIPIIAAYTSYSYVLDPNGLAGLWPPALATRINDGSARVLHIPFKQDPLVAAVGQFDHNNLPTDGRSYYSRQDYENWGLLRRMAPSHPFPKNG